MATNFPASLDTLTNPTSSDSLSSPSHSAQHANVNDAVEALQAKVGADSSAVTTSLDYKVAQLEAVSHGKILQVVRATDTTNRVTSSTSFVDASISVTITPTSASSTVMLIWSFSASQGGAGRTHHTQITDSSNTAISGAEDCRITSAAADLILSQTNVAYDSPATTSATTYKGRFKSGNAQNVALTNSQQTGQLYAVEIAS